MKINFFFTICLLYFSFNVFGQDISDNNEKPKHVKEKAENFIFDGKFDEAVDLYKNLLKTNPDDSDINFKLGYCLLNSKKGRFEAIEYLEKSKKSYDETNKTGVPFFACEYYLARAYQVNYEFDRAIETYQGMKHKALKKRMLKEIDKQIASCQTAKTLFENPEELIVTKLGAVNSPFSDHSPVVSADESVIIFTSKREGSTGGMKSKEGEFYEDIYIYDKRKGIHSKPENVGLPVNTNGHEADCGLSVDGQILYIYKSSEKDAGDIYSSTLNGSSWSEPVRLNKNINSKKREVHASLSSDGRFLYFSSNRRGSKGGMDIWVSEKSTDGTWGKARNLGNTINTSGDEEGPFIHPDGKTLYFSSEGHPGMGKLDVFYSTRQADGTWTTPKNLGFPLNTVDDDVFYVPSADGKRGYYASQSGGQSNIYMATLFNQAEKVLTIVSGIAEDGYIRTQSIDKTLCSISSDTIVLPDKRTFIKKKYYKQGDSVVSSVCDINVESVDVYDSIYTVPFESKIYVLDTDTKTLENSYSPNAVSGKFLFVLNQKKNYKIYFESENHIFDTKDIALKGDSSFKHIYKIAQMDTMIRGKIRKTKNVVFDPKSDRLNNFTSLEMDLLSDFLKKYPNLKVNFSACDYLTKKVDPRYLPENFQFGEKRQKSLIDYLLQKGIDPGRIYTDLSSNPISGDSVEYTIYDEMNFASALKEKDDRTRAYDEALVAAKKEQEEILKDFGLISQRDSSEVEITDMLFEIKQHKTNQYNENIQKLSDYLKENPDAIIEIGGYTDMLGSLAFNKKLAEKRAGFIKTNLLKNGVAEKQIVTKNYNIQNPIAHNKTKSGELCWEALPYNRRVEIKVLKQGEKKELDVKPIDVPVKYRIDGPQPEKNPFYSISLKTSQIKLDTKLFSGISGIKEKQIDDGSFIYYIGNFKTEKEAQKSLEKIKKDFPEAIIFIREF